ncbi:MAG TPA: ABC transporter ATP-binding protein [Clostridiaceae bacterium]|jgi:ABC-2 type transport system ATP-binding protein|nr:ABC transporter ATP-binding protein [Clostridiaceae bacterium]
MLRVNDIRLSYGRETVLRGIRFEASPGEVIGLLGANGTGKSSLIEILAGVLIPDSGTVSLYDVDIRDRRHYLSMVGFVPQSIALTMHLSGYDNLRQWGGLKGLSGNDLQQAVTEAGVLCGLESFWHKPVYKQSGGMQRRINLASGLIGLPRLLLLDEPTAGLDRESRERILDAIQAIKAKGVMVVMTNHYEPEQDRIADRKFILDEGILCEPHA